ncbi:two component system response regulator, sigma54-specific [Desulfosarcina variabilis str. Montpellier]|uniref:sigma-54 interaction domain-containing protein n=1 Tax=Desulfosarcina variabilis TaxID=2300 RepID=UPI003AFAC0FC
MAVNQSEPSLKALEEKCQLLENQCSEYVRALERTNQRLEKEIRKQKRTESRLKISEMRFRKIFEHAPFGAAIADREGSIVLANHALCRMLGYSQHELQRMHFADITHKEDVDADMERFRQLIDGAIDHYNLEKRYHTKQNKVIWGSMAATLIHGRNPQERSILGMVEDISERKRTEKKIIQSRDDLEAVVAERTREIQSLKDRLQAENLILKQELAESQSYGTIIGESHPIKTVISQIELVAPTDANVLIHGESGTGKELVAREIHRHSQRQDNPLIKVNCATIPKDLYESEFFGHVKGAFTGAVKDRIGRFEAADGGTIFLDEVGEIPLDLQSKLLRILQEGEYERVGDDKTRKVNVRIIAATNKSLLSEVRAKRFRDDLFYRLNVFPIQIAPLRDRKEDIQLLATHFVEKLSRKLNVPPPQLTQANILDLQSYDWPGNVRELENTVERAIILSRSTSLNFSAMQDFALTDTEPRVDRAAKPQNRETVLSADAMQQFDRQNTINALKQCKWKIYGNDGAAHLLGIKPTTLIERMKRMRIRKPSKKASEAH